MPINAKDIAKLQNAIISFDTVNINANTVTDIKNSRILLRDLINKAETNEDFNLLTEILIDKMNSVYDANNVLYDVLTNELYGNNIAYNKEKVLWLDNLVTSTQFNTLLIIGENTHI